MIARPATLPERIVALEEKAEVQERRSVDVETRLRRIEKILWGIVAIELGLKFLL